MVNLGPAVLNESFVRDVVVVMTQLLSFKLQPAEKKFCLEGAQKQEEGVEPKKWLFVVRNGSKLRTVSV